MYLHYSSKQEYCLFQSMCPTMSPPKTKPTNCSSLWAKGISYGLLGRKPYAWHSVIFIIREGTSYAWHSVIIIWKWSSYDRFFFFFSCVSTSATLITEVGTSYNTFSFVISISSFCASRMASLPAKKKDYRSLYSFYWQVLKYRDYNSSIRCGLWISKFLVKHLKIV